jgi:hypothetical protein
MKKTIIASILGVAACAAVTTSYGQGSIFFANYSFGVNSYSAPVTFGGQVVGSDFSAQLLYSATGQSGTFSALPGSTLQFLGTGLGDTADGGGLFQGTGVTVAAYPNTVSGNAWFEVSVFNTATVGANAPGTITGISAPVQVGALATAANNLGVSDLFPDNPNLVTAGGLQPFTVSSVPEPTTLALAGLGGLASLVMLRRKTA